MMHCTHASPRRTARLLLRLLLPLWLPSTLTLLAGCTEDNGFKVDNQQGSVDDATSSLADISGIVVDVQGRAIADAVIVTTPYGRTAATDANGRKIIDSFITDIDGHYFIPQQPFGSYTLEAFASGYQPGARSIGNVDFLPQHLQNGGMIKHFSLAEDFNSDPGNTPAVALFDNEDKKRMTELLTSKGIRYVSVRDTLAQLSIADFRVLVLGLDSTVYSDFTELIAAQTVISQFISAGGHLVIGQTNDFSIENTDMPFLTGDRRFQLHVENAPFNDFQSGLIKDASHPLVQGVTFLNWNYIEPGQQQLKQNLVFDAAIKASFTGPNWQIIVSTPATDFVGSGGIVVAESDVIIAEYIDPVSGGRIVVNQAAYYQGAYGDVVDGNALRLTENLAQYIKWLNSGAPL